MIKQILQYHFMIQHTIHRPIYFNRSRLAGMIIISSLMLVLTSCGIYTFNDTGGIDYTKVKTIKLFTIENKASYVNPQLSPKLYDKLLQKFTSSTKLTRTNNDDAHYQVIPTITSYSGSQTVGISGQQATTNRLTVSVHVVLKKLWTTRPMNLM